MGLFSNLLQTKLFTKIAGHKVGEDEFGNQYYLEKMLLGKPQRPLKRWVIYKSGAVDASCVPAKWFGWLHYSMERPIERESHDWVKPHQYNVTGSNQAYRPQSSLLNAGASDYESPVPKPYTPWNPNLKGNTDGKAGSNTTASKS